MNRLEVVASNALPDRPIYLVHGFAYDPETPKHDPNKLFFPALAKGISPRQTVGFPYYSAPLNLKGILRSWLHGRYNTYRYAWDLAKEAGLRLRADLIKNGVEVDIICHSLGARVVLEALNTDAVLPVRRVLVLNGAEHVSKAKKVLRKNSQKTEFLNICVFSDDVLHKMGALFSPGVIYEDTIGYNGLLPQTYDNWIDVQLDAIPTKKLAETLKTTLVGDNPTSIGDHWYSYRYQPNWVLYRMWLNDHLAIKETPN